MILGTLEIPDMDLIPENNVKVHTRQGVDVHFDTRACVAVWNIYGNKKRVFS